MNDNLLSATDNVRKSVCSLKTKLSSVKISIEQFGVEIEKIDNKLNQLTSESEVYKQKLKREYNSKIIKLEDRIKALEKMVRSYSQPVPEDVLTRGDNFHTDEMKIASTVEIFETFLDRVYPDFDSLRYMMYSVIYPKVYINLLGPLKEKFFLQRVPEDFDYLIEEGKSFILSFRTEHKSHLNSPEKWNAAIGTVEGFIVDDLLPLIYSDREIPIIGETMTFEEMKSWRDSPHKESDFSELSTVVNSHKVNREKVREANGIEDFEADLKIKRIREGWG